MTIPIDRALDGPVNMMVMPPRPPQTTVLGVSGAAAQPYICAVRYSNHLVSPGDALFNEEPIFETRYEVLGAEELAPGLQYPYIARRVNRLARNLYQRDSRGDYHVLVDASGVGRPIVHAIRDTITPQVNVTAITVNPGNAGDLSCLWRYETVFGLEYLVSRVSAIVQSRRLTIPSAYPDLVAAVMAYSLETAPDEAKVRALALACCSEYQPIRYGASPDKLPSPKL